MTRDATRDLSSPSHPAEAARHIRVLDGLRALAIALVMVFHAGAAWRATPALVAATTVPFGWARFVLGGWCGVNLFFILSGFLIAGQLMRGMEGGASRAGVIRQFYRRRVARIVPAYYAMLALLFIFNLHAAAGQGSIPPALYACNAWHLAFMQDYVCTNYYLIFWSLAVEMKFYLLAPALMGLLLAETPVRRYAVLGLLIVAAMALRAQAVAAVPATALPAAHSYAVLHIAFHLGYDALLTGVACAFLARDLKFPFASRAAATWLFLAGLAALIMLFGSNRTIDQSTAPLLIVFAPTVINCCFAAMLLGLLGGCHGDWLFKTHAGQGLARISYSVYLQHLFVLSLVMSHLTTLCSGPQCWLRLPPAAGLLLAFALTMLTATTAYYLIERPVIRRSART